jgi:oligopeptidase B
VPPTDPGSSAAEPLPTTPPSAPPSARKQPVTRTHHGDTVTDPYEWLRDGEDPAVLAHLRAENAWAQARTGHLAALREQLFEEVRTRTQESDLSVPAREGDWWYYSRTLAGAQYPLVCRAPALAAGEGAGEGAGGGAGDAWTPPATAEGEPLDGEQVLLDANAEAGDHAFFSLGAVALSPDGARLAWSSDTTGDERYLLRVRDLTAGPPFLDLPDEVPGTAGSAAWADDSATLFFLRVDEAWRPHQVVRHLVGTPAEADEVVHTEPDERFWLGLERTRSGAFLLATSASKTTAETWALRADDHGGAFALLLPRRAGVDHSVEHAVIGGRGRFLVLSDDGAQDFRLDLTPDDRAPAAPPGEWTAVLPHTPGTRLEQVEAFAGFLAVGYRREALPRVGTITIADDAGGAEGTGGGLGPLVEVAFDEPLSSAHVLGGRTFDQPVVRLAHGSFTTPSGVFDLHVPTAALHLRRRTPVLGGYDPAAYEEHRTWATAADGTQVPVSVVARAGTPRDGTAPALLYGYGSYEVSTDPGFSVARLSLLDRGVVFAVAHVRGGGELGRHWYEQGRREHKPNTFTDYLAAAGHLAAQGWVDGARVVATGGSAGGLLVGAALNLAPSAFAGVLAAVPFVDPLTTMLDESLPLTVVEQEEWGDPIRDPAAYATIKGYAPYDNLAPRPYPPMLVTTSLHDTRVMFTEPAKWVARLRELDPSGGGAPGVLLKTELDGGHGGRSGRYESWRERAYEHAWALDVLGLA